MKNGDFAKIALIVIGGTLALGFMTENTSTADVYSVLTTILTAVFLLLVYAATSERVTEILKSFLRSIFGGIKFLNSWQPNKAGSWFLALAVALAGVYQLDIDVLKELALFKDLDPKTLQLMNTAVVWLTSNVLHKPLEKFAGAAQKAKGPPR